MAKILYKLTFPNGKIYVGQTVRKMNIRLAQHRTAAARGSALPVHCAWRKHGEPSVSILGEYETKDELHAAEIAAIASMNCLSPNGYNLAYGGDTSPAINPEVARKISESNKGKAPSMSAESRKEMISELWRNEEYRAAQTAAQRAKWADPEYKAKMSAKRKAYWERKKAEGWVMSEDHKAKLRGRKRSEETRAKMSVSAKLRGPRPEVSEETRAKLSARAKDAWQNEELTARRIEAMRKAKETESAS
jgi:hypothetical protein